MTTTHRRTQIIQLLSSRYDTLYLPNGSLTTPAGLTPATLEPCPTCKGTKTTRDRYGHTKQCDRCNGKGKLAYDPMDSLHIPIGSTHTTATAHPHKTIPCDACNGQGAHGNGQRCTHCDGAGRRDQHAFELHLDTRDQEERSPLDQAIETRNQSGSYHQLDQALAGLSHHINKPAHYQPLTALARRARRLLDNLYLPPATILEHELPAVDRVLVELALRYIDERMPHPIRVPAGVRDNTRQHTQHRRRQHGRGTDTRSLEQRDREIRKLIRQGRPTQWVAQQYGLSPIRINTIARTTPS